MEFVPFLALIALNKKFVDLVKEFLPNATQNKVVQLIAFVIGVALAFGFSESRFGDGIEVWEGLTLAGLDAWGVAIYGLAVAAGAGVANDFIERRNPDASPDTS